MNSKSYAIVTASYWGFTLTDGALRMIVLLFFHQLGFTPLQLAFLFLLYEFCGIVTNLMGGWVGSRIGLKFTLFTGLTLQISSLLMLSLVDTSWALAVSVAYVMATQALSGIAKDLTKMSSKSAVKVLIQGGEGVLFKWVAILTGSKNALKGVGFLLGGLLLTCLGFVHALWLMAGCLAVILLIAIACLRQDIGKSKRKVKFTQLFAKRAEMNWLSGARGFLFAARDVWFVVAVPVFLNSDLGWASDQVGLFMAVWVMGYGIIQAGAPRLVSRQDPRCAAVTWVVLLALLTTALAIVIKAEYYLATSLLIGLSAFGIVFAVNSSVHSYLILSLTNDDEVALDVGFYYMANAWGRLVGTLLSGVMFIAGGLSLCLFTSAGLLTVAAILSLPLRTKNRARK